MLAQLPQDILTLGNQRSNRRRASLVAQMVKNPPTMQETRVQSLDWEDPLEKGQATHSSILPGEFHGQRSLVKCSPFSHKELDRTEGLTLSLQMEERVGLLATCHKLTNNHNCLLMSRQRIVGSHQVYSIFYYVSPHTLKTT